MRNVLEKIYFTVVIFLIVGFLVGIAAEIDVIVVGFGAFGIFWLLLGALVAIWSN